MESISSKTLRNLTFPLPPYYEQKKIAKTHLNISELLTGKKQLESLISLKKALM